MSSFYQIVDSSLVEPLKTLDEILRKDDISAFKEHLNKHEDLYKKDALHWRVYLLASLAPQCSQYLIHTTLKHFSLFSEQGKISILGSFLSTGQLEHFKYLMTSHHTDFMKNPQNKEIILYYALQSKTPKELELLFTEFNLDIDNNLNEIMAKTLYNSQNEDFVKYYLQYLLDSKEFQKIIHFYHLIVSQQMNNVFPTENHNHIISISHRYFLETQLKSNSRQGNGGISKI